MKRIEQLLVVEGKHDEARLKKLFDCDVLCTNGLGFDNDILEIVRQASEGRGAIILTDPDHPGVRIRDALREAAPQAQHAFIEKNDAIGRRNVGVEYAREEAIRDALENLVSFGENRETVSLRQYESLGLSGDSRKREYVTSQLHLGKCNNKRLRRYLNMLGIEFEKVKEIAEAYERENHRL
ncbi:MAG: ribonuclease M5 [Erysipelotrichaceae bacterium]|nr:ribonuclease M5 [Erysipelotrichaceae bacterium]